MKTLHLFLSLTLLTGLMLYPAAISYAGGGGRAVITVDRTGVAGGQAAEITATIYKDNDMKISPDEFGIFRIQNVQPGQNCITKNQRSNGEGKIYGSCTSPVTGDMRVYIHFPDKVEDAQAYSVPIVAKGAPIPQPTVSTATAGPCASGLTSYGWDETNGSTCPQHHFDKWTATCGNGYKEHVAIGNCLHANQLTNHDDWRIKAEAICASPRCALPVTNTVTPKPTQKATPKPTVVPTATPEPIATAQSTISADPTPEASVVPAVTKNPVSRFLQFLRSLFGR